MTKSPHFSFILLVSISFYLFSSSDPPPAKLSLYISWDKYTHSYIHNFIDREMRNITTICSFIQMSTRCIVPLTQISRFAPDTYNPNKHALCGHILAGEKTGHIIPMHKAINNASFSLMEICNLLRVGLLRSQNETIILLFWKKYLLSR